MWNKGQIRLTIFGLAIIAIIIIVVIVALNGPLKKDYNNGICLKCGGHYELYDIVASKAGPIYYYQCDSCKNMIMGYELLQPDN